MKRSLEGGFRIRETFGIVSDLRARGLAQPIVLMTYVNPVLRMGEREFCAAASRAGADGILPVDLPPEESKSLEAQCRTQGLDLIRLVAPSTSDLRIDEVVSQSSGFVYAVSVSGVTGARNQLPESAVSLLRRITPRTRLPVALGFGISKPEHVREAIAAGAAGIVEGSALVSIYAGSLADRGEGLRLVSEHASEMKRAASSKNKARRRNGT
ncbi:MAG: tryptophan synthase subunit alpha [Euryarchaeota archaeon RBG_16_62_10]|nr:MAG: tryptophan synthase subunit alpha [Euryarchaeota archaeon RBG_16_62_10]